MDCSKPIRFTKLVRDELDRARKIHPQKHNSLHEGYAILLEELDELWDEVRKRPGVQSMPLILAELVQIGAMAQRVAEEVVLTKMGDPLPKEKRWTWEELGMNRPAVGIIK